MKIVTGLNRRVLTLLLTGLSSLSAQATQITIANQDGAGEGFNDNTVVAPVGGKGVQRLMVYEKRGQELSERFICDVRFVKLVGEYGFEQ